MAELKSLRIYFEADTSEGCCGSSVQIEEIALMAVNLRQVIQASLAKPIDDLLNLIEEGKNDG